jgi:hypothetical protein
MILSEFGRGFACNKLELFEKTGNIFKTTFKTDLIHIVLGFN